MLVGGFLDRLLSISTTDQSVYCRTVRPSVSISTLTDEITAVSRVETWFPAMGLVEANAKGRRKRDQIPGKGFRPSARVSQSGLRLVLVPDRQYLGA